LAKDLIPIAANKQNVDSQSVFCKNLIDNMLRNMTTFYLNYMKWSLNLILYLS